MKIKAISLALALSSFALTACSGGTDSASAAVQNYIDSVGGNSNPHLTANCTDTGQFENGANVYSCSYSGDVQNPTEVGSIAFGTCWAVSGSNAQPSRLGC